MIKKSAIQSTLVLVGELFSADFKWFELPLNKSAARCAR